MSEGINAGHATTLPPYADSKFKPKEKPLLPEVKGHLVALAAAQHTIGTSLKRAHGPSAEETSAKRYLPDPNVTEPMHTVAESQHDQRTTGNGIAMLELDQESIEASTRCPICLGIIKQCRTVKVCLHRFCGDCIEQALRFNNNECPACRAHLPSRRALHRDSRFDALVKAIYGSIHSYEEEESKQLEEDTKSYAYQFQKENQALMRKLNGGVKSFQKTPDCVSNPSMEVLVI